MTVLMALDEKIPHDCERSHTGVVLGEHFEDIIIVAQQKRFDKGVERVA